MTADAEPFPGHNFRLRELEGRMRKAAADLEFEEAGRLRDEIKRLKMLDLEFANEAPTPEGEQADRNAAKLARAEARAAAAERYRKGDSGGGVGIPLPLRSTTSADLLFLRPRRSGSFVIACR